jgi:hypothetical protein
VPGLRRDCRRYSESDETRIRPVNQRRRSCPVVRLQQLQACASRIPQGARRTLYSRLRRPSAHHRLRAGGPDQYLQRRPVRLHRLPADRLGPCPRRHGRPDRIQYRRKLRKGYLRDPDVSVEVDRYRPVFVMGEVGAAGQYSYVPGMTVQKAIAMAGGFSARAQPGIGRRYPRHQRKGDDRPRRTSDPLLPGDTVYVRERLF